MPRSTTGNNHLGESAWMRHAHKAGAPDSIGVAPMADNDGPHMRSNDYNQFHLRLIASTKNPSPLRLERRPCMQKREPRSPTEPRSRWQAADSATRPPSRNSHAGKRQQSDLDKRAGRPLALACPSLAEALAPKQIHKPCIRRAGSRCALGRRTSMRRASAESTGCGTSDPEGNTWVCYVAPACMEWPNQARKKGLPMGGTEGASRATKHMPRRTYQDQLQDPTKRASQAQG